MIWGLELPSITPLKVLPGTIISSVMLIDNSLLPTATVAHSPLTDKLLILDNATSGTPVVSTAYLTPFPVIFLIFRQPLHFTIYNMCSTNFFG